MASEAVPTALDGAESGICPEWGKSDPIDALAVALTAGGFPRSGFSELKLLVD